MVPKLSSLLWCLVCHRCSHLHRLDCTLTFSKWLVSLEMFIPIQDGGQFLAGYLDIYGRATAAMIKLNARFSAQGSQNSEAVVHHPELCLQLDTLMTIAANVTINEDTAQEDPESHATAKGNESEKVTKWFFEANFTNHIC